MPRRAAPDWLSITDFVVDSSHATRTVYSEQTNARLRCVPIWRPPKTLLRTPAAASRALEQAGHLQTYRFPSVSFSFHVSLLSASLRGEILALSPEGFSRLRTTSFSFFFPPPPSNASVPTSLSFFFLPEPVGAWCSATASLTRRYAEKISSFTIYFPRSLRLCFLTGCWLGPPTRLLPQSQIYVTRNSLWRGLANFLLALGNW